MPCKYCGREKDSATVCGPLKWCRPTGRECASCLMVLRLHLELMGQDEGKRGEYGARSVNKTNRLVVSISSPWPSGQPRGRASCTSPCLDTRLRFRKPRTSYRSSTGIVDRPPYCRMFMHILPTLDAMS